MHDALFPAHPERGPAAKAAAQRDRHAPPAGEGDAPEGAPARSHGHAPGDAPKAAHGHGHRFVVPWEI